MGINERKRNRFQKVLIHEIFHNVDTGVLSGMMGRGHGWANIRNPRRVTVG